MKAIIKLNVRTFDDDVRTRVLAAIERIVNAEAKRHERQESLGSHRWMVMLQ